MRNNTVITTGLLITGTGRSGTGLLWKILSTHTKLRVAYEPLSDNKFKLMDAFKYNGIKQPAFHWNFEDCVADKYIFMKRNTLDTLYSLLKRNKVDMDNAKLFYSKILEINKNIDIFTEENPEKALIVCYEDLCLDTENTVKNICIFLGILYQPHMLLNWARVKVPKWAVTVQYITSGIVLQTRKYLGDKEYLKIVKNLKVENDKI